MKTIFLTLITISFLLVGCKKENPDEQEIALLGDDVILTYSDEIINPFESTVTINNIDYNFNRIVAQYLQAETNQNVFFVNLLDTINKTGIGLGIYPPDLKTEDFFKIDKINIDKLNIYWSGSVEKFDNINATFNWEQVSFNDRKFNGLATFELTEKIEGQTTFPTQKIEFEFN